MGLSTPGTGSDGMNTTENPLILLDPHPRAVDLIFDVPTRKRLESLGRVIWQAFESLGKTILNGAVESAVPAWNQILSAGKAVLPAAAACWHNRQSVARRKPEFPEPDCAGSSRVLPESGRSVYSFASVSRSSRGVTKRGVGSPSNALTRRMCPALFALARCLQIPCDQHIATVE